MWYVTNYLTISALNKRLWNCFYQIQIQCDSIYIFALLYIMLSFIYFVLWGDLVWKKYLLFVISVSVNLTMLQIDQGTLSKRRRITVWWRCIFRLHYNEFECRLLRVYQHFIFNERWFRSMHNAVVICLFVNTNPFLYLLHPYPISTLVNKDIYHVKYHRIWYCLIHCHFKCKTWNGLDLISFLTRWQKFPAQF